MNNAWVVRYGNYAVVLNRSTKPCAIKLPAGSGNATAVKAAAAVRMGSTASVAAGAYEVFVFLSAKHDAAAPDLGSRKQAGSR